jgi:hypothetical protein
MLKVAHDAPSIPAAPSIDGSNRPTSRSLTRFVATLGPNGRAAAFLVLVFLASRAVVLALGFHYDLEWLGLSIQNIDPELLQHRLLQSLWYMHGQPPLWNAILGVSLKLFPKLYPQVWHIGYLALGLTEALALFALQLELHVPRRVAVAIAAVITVAPATLVYENVFFYDYPTIVLVTLTTLAVLRFADKPTFGRGLLAFGLAASLVLMRTLFQWPWLLLMVAILYLACKSNRRAVLLSAALPFALVAAVIAKNWIMYDVPSTTSWSGMNFARIADASLSLRDRRQLVHEGKLHGVSLVTPLSALSAYEAVGVKPAHKTGIPLLDNPGDAYFPRNLENRTFIKISNLYLTDDIWIVEHRPGAFLRAVGNGFNYFFAPPTLPWVGIGNTGKIGGYDRWFSRVVYGKLGPGKDGFFLIAIYLAAVITGAWITARRLRPGAGAETVTIAFMLLTLLYVGIVGNFAEFGENYRFRLLLDPIAFALAAVGIQQVARRLLARPSSGRDG